MEENKSPEESEHQDENETDKINRIRFGTMSVWKSLNIPGVTSKYFITLEQLLYEECDCPTKVIQMHQTYKNRRVQLTYNLQQDGSRLVTQFTPVQLLQANSHQLSAPFAQASRRTRDEQYKLKQLQETTFTLNESDEQALWRHKVRCPIHTCTSDRLVTEMKQTRSSDEGMTAFYTCLSCGHQWKHH